jgi:hypothetical protein
MLAPDIAVFASDVPAARRDEILEKIARKTVDLRLGPVAIVMLEANKPLSFVGSQLMIFFQPVVTAIFPFTQYDEIAALLEDRANVERLIQTIEKLEDERRHGKRQDNKNPGN